MVIKTKRAQPRNRGRLRRRDVLREIWQGKLTVKEAYDLSDKIIATGLARKWDKLMGMSLAESTAHGHGVPLAVIAKWRYEGWPDVCFRCGKKIDLPAFGWWAGDKRKGRYHLTHIRCLKPS